MQTLVKPVMPHQRLLTPPNDRVSTNIVSPNHLFALRRMPLQATFPNQMRIYLLRPHQLWTQLVLPVSKVLMEDPYNQNHSGLNPYSTAAKKKEDKAVITFTAMILLHRTSPV